MFPTISFFIAALIILVAIYLCIKTDIIKNPTEANSHPPHKSYSFSRTQLMWWTVIISCCFIIMYGETGLFNLNQTVLVLLGIGAATTTGGNIIDSGQAAATPSNDRHQDAKSVHFVHDILSDGHGISTHRFQAVVFNVLFGLIFIAYFFTDKFTLPNFDQYQYGLMGVSSGTYLALKTNENKSPANKVQQQNKATS